MSSVSKESTWNAGDPSLIPGSSRSPGEGSGNPLQYSSMDRGAWQAPWGHKSWTQLSNQTTTQYSIISPMTSLMPILMALYSDVSNISESYETDDYPSPPGKLLFSSFHVKTLSFLVFLLNLYPFLLVLVCMFLIFSFFTHYSHFVLIHFQCSDYHLSGDED